MAMTIPEMTTARVSTPILLAFCDVPIIFAMARTADILMNSAPCRASGPIVTLRRAPLMISPKNVMYIISSTEKPTKT